MKNRGILFVVLFLLLVSILFISLFISNVHAIEIQSPEQIIGINPNNIPNNPDEVKDVASEYLKHEWTNILERSSAGRFLLGVNKIFVALSPIFKLIIGVEYSLSWYFFLSLFLWFFIFIIIYHTLKDIILLNGWMVIGIGFIIPTLAARFDSFGKTVDFLAGFVDNIWLVISLILIMIAIIYFYEAFMNSFGKAMKKKMNKDIEKRRELKAKTVEELHDIELKARRN